jgi:hypothetical protein
MYIDLARVWALPTVISCRDLSMWCYHGVMNRTHYENMAVCRTAAAVTLDNAVERHSMSVRLYKFKNADVSAYHHVILQTVLHDSLHDSLSSLHSYSKCSGHCGRTRWSFNCIVNYQAVFIWYVKNQRSMQSQGRDFPRLSRGTR